MAYEEINPGMWTPKKDGDSLEGIYIRAETDIGPQKSIIYHLEQDKKPISLWGCTILDQKMAWIRPGDKIKITYLGLAEKKPGKNQAKLFKVEVDREPIEPSNVDTDEAGIKEDSTM